MAYVVEITPRAELDLELIYKVINAVQSIAAQQWFQGFRQAIRSLQNKPNRCPPTPEDTKLRHLLYGERPHIYRAIFRVLENQKKVEVIHIRHGAGRPFKKSEVM